MMELLANKSVGCTSSWLDPLHKGKRDSERPLLSLTSQLWFKLATCPPLSPGRWLWRLGGAGGLSCWNFQQLPNFYIWCRFTTKQDWSWVAAFQNWFHSGSVLGCVRETINSRDILASIVMSLLTTRVCGSQQPEHNPSMNPGWTPDRENVSVVVTSALSYDSNK